MLQDERDEARYTIHGYKDRDDYLQNLADNHGVEVSVVNMIADVFGDSEDFDGLVSELEDLEYAGLLDEFRKEEGGEDE